MAIPGNRCRVLAVCVTLMIMMIHLGKRSAGSMSRAGLSRRSQRTSQLKNLPQPFETSPLNHSLLCEEGIDSAESLANNKSGIRAGLMFLKTFKTGSSTASGVNLRIAHNIAARLNRTFKFCNSRFDHGEANKLFRKRDKARSFLWTVLREPEARVTSHFFFKMVSRQRESPSDDHFRSFALEEAQNTYISQLSFSKFPQGSVNVTFALNEIKSILSEYNFIGITERFDESLVVLQMLLDLPVEDLLYLKAKQNGGYDAGGAKNKCTYISPPFVSARMKSWFNSSEWKKTVKYDAILYRAANKSLDLTIDRLGRSKFEKLHARFLTVQQLSMQKCQATTVFPCDFRGQFLSDTDCVWKDSGCGWSCLDKALAGSLNS